MTINVPQGQNQSAGRSVSTPENVQDPEARRILQEHADQIAEIARAIPEATPEETAYTQPSGVTRLAIQRGPAGSFLLVYGRRSTFQGGKLTGRTEERLMTKLPMATATVSGGGGGTTTITNNEGNLLPTGWLKSGG